MSRIEIIAMIKPPARHSTTNAISTFCCNDIPALACRQQFLYLRPLPHGQGAFRPIFSIRTIYFETPYLTRTFLRPVVLILKLGWCPQVTGRVLARIFHEGGPGIVGFLPRFSRLAQFERNGSRIRLVLFGFRKNLALHLGRSTPKSLNSHRSHYGSAADRPSCCASCPLNSESFIKYAGRHRG